MRPRLLLFGGIDPSGGAGLTVDAAVAAACGVDPLPIVVATTVQSRRGFVAFEPVPVSSWRAAAAAQLQDAPVQAIKVGFVGAAEVVRELAAFVREFAPGVSLLVDPVLGATAGGLTTRPGLLDAYRQALLPVATLCTPNVPELRELFDGDAARALATGCGAVLCKGGHDDGEHAVDVLVQPAGTTEFRRPRRRVGAVRGTGCCLASAIAALLAAGVDLRSACGRAGDQLAALLAMMGPPAADGLPRRLPLASWPTG